MGSTAAYRQAVVFPNRQSESLLQLFDALEALQGTVDDIFGRIKTRVGQEKERIDGISSRLEIAKNKVQRIAGSTKAIKVHSSAKYPAPAQLESYHPLYVDVEAKPPRHTRYHLTDVPHLPPGAAPKDPMLDDPFLPESMPLQDRTEDVKEGLGRLPVGLSSISALLLFNTQENPYKKYVSLDNLAGKEVVTEQLTKKEALADAPTTLGPEGDQTLHQAGIIEYGYKPVLGEVPEFNLPSVLPDLPMVADISWGSVDIPEFTSIAPSTKSHLPPELPEVTPDLPVDETVGSDAGPPASEVPPPPPIIAPPPPPPAANIPPPPPAPEGPPPPPVKLGGPTTAEDRADLLSDIRKGHMNRLKDVKQRNLEDAPPSISGEPEHEQQRPPPVTSTGDIFSELIMALNRRRVGMKGEAPPKKSKKSKARAGASDHIKLPEPDASKEEVPEGPAGASSGEDEGSDDSDWEA